MRKFNKIESKIPFSAYRVDKNYLAQIENDDESLINVCPNRNLYCGPVISIDNIDYFIPVTEYDNKIIEDEEYRDDITTYDKSQTWVSQLKLFENNKLGGYNFNTLLPCESKNISPANYMNKEELANYNYILSHETLLKTMAEFVCKHYDCYFLHELDLKKYDTPETNISFNAYRIDPKYLEFLAKNSNSGIRCYPDENLYCGPTVITYDEKRDCYISFFVPVSALKNEIAEFGKDSTWQHQVETSKTGVYGGYDFATMLPCLSKHLTPAAKLTDDEQNDFDFLQNNKDYLKNLTEIILKYNK